MKINGSSRLYFIIGDPIAQVKSPEAFNSLFEQRGTDAVLLPLHVDAQSIDATLSALKKTRNVDGVVLTVPHKFAGFRQCDSTSKTSSLLRAANVMRRLADGSWHGDMVDGLGYVAALQREGCTLAGSTALLVGAGGAGSAIASSLALSGVSQLYIHDEHPERARTLVDLLSGAGGALVQLGSRDPHGMQIVVNATPMGMKPDDPSPVLVDRLSPSMFVGDVITAPAISPLLEAAMARGCKVLTGAQMYDAVFELMAEFFGLGAATPSGQT